MYVSQWDDCYKLLNKELQKQVYFKIVYILFTSLISYKDLRWEYYGFFFSPSNDV